MRLVDQWTRERTSFLAVGMALPTAFLFHHSTGEQRCYNNLGELVGTEINGNFLSERAAAG